MPRIVFTLALLLPSGAALAAPDEASLAPLAAADWTPEAAAHLLRRAGFDGTPGESLRLHARGLTGAVDLLLAWEGRDDPGMPPAPIAVTAAPGRDVLAGKTPEERQRIRQEHRRADQRQFALVREWWVQTMIRTAHPLRERLVLYWHGHFTSGYRDVRNSYHLFVQNTLFRRHAAGNFRTLLHEVSRDPAMLEYLDNNRNRKGRPNENYAREVMELFTLGEGHYTEEDIREAARALTGWTFQGNRFVFDRRSHDDGEKRFLGRTGRFDGGHVLDIILEQPAASRFLARRLFAYFAHDAPAEAVVEGLARTLRDNDWELRPMLRRLFCSQAFFAAPAVATRIKSPVDMLVGLWRCLGLEPSGAAGLSFLAQALGEALMEPPNVRGWPGGRAWITTSTLLNRYNIACAVVGLPDDRRRTLRNQRMPGLNLLLQATMRRDPNGRDDDMVSALYGEAPRAVVYDAVAEVRRLGMSTPAAVVDYFAGALLAGPVPGDLRGTLVAHLTRDGGFDLERPDARARLHGLLRLIVSTPEFQLC